MGVENLRINSDNPLFQDSAAFKIRKTRVFNETRLVQF